jgi:hypothetical protein
MPSVACLPLLAWVTMGQQSIALLVLEMAGSSQITKPSAVASQPSPTLCYKVYVFFQIHTTKGSCKNIVYWSSNIRLVMAIVLVIL